MEKEKKDKVIKKKKRGAWTIGWGWMITVPVLTFLSWATKKGLKDALEDEKLKPDLISGFFCQ
ncbi:MAG: hypothetical protein ACOC2E_06185 [Bacteroidota bacterium]